MHVIECFNALVKLICGEVEELLLENTAEASEHVDAEDLDIPFETEYEDDELLIDDLFKTEHLL